MPIHISHGGQAKSDLLFWLSKTPKERVEAVEFLREQHYALSGEKKPPRLVRTLRLRKRSS